MRPLDQPLKNGWGWSHFPGTVKLKPSPEGEPTRGWSEEILNLGRDKALKDGFAETENNPRWLGFT